MSDPKGAEFGLRHPREGRGLAGLTGGCGLSFQFPSCSRQECTCVKICCVALTHRTGCDC